MLGIGGVHADGQAFRDYATRHEEVTGAKPDFRASAMVHSTFPVREQAIEAVGLDNAKTIRHVKDGSFQTGIGTLDFDENSNNPAFWTVGLGQGGVFRGVASTGRDGAVAVVKKGGWA